MSAVGILSNLSQSDRHSVDSGALSQQIGKKSDQPTKNEKRLLETVRQNRQNCPLPIRIRGHTRTEVAVHSPTSEAAELIAAAPWLYAGQVVHEATDAESFALARVLWPVLHEVETESTEWSAREQHLLTCDLPVQVYDLAVDVLHPGPPPLPQRKLTRADAVAELRRLGYTGSINLSTGVLRRMLQDRERTG